MFLAKSAPASDNQVVPQSCSHITDYDSKRTQQYQTLCQRYEVRSHSAGTTAGSVTADQQRVSDNQKKCITVLMSRLCDPVRWWINSIHI